MLMNIKLSYAASNNIIVDYNGHVLIKKNGWYDKIISIFV